MLCIMHEWERVKILTNGCKCKGRHQFNCTGYKATHPTHTRSTLRSCVINVIKCFRDPSVGQLQRYQTKRGVPVDREAESRCQGPKRQTSLLTNFYMHQCYMQRMVVAKKKKDLASFSKRVLVLILSYEN